MTVLEPTSEDARRSWYRDLMDADPKLRERFDLARTREQTDPGPFDDMDEINRLLGDGPG